MGTSLILRAMNRNEDRIAKCSLSLRSHDLGGTDYSHLATLTIEQGISLAMGERAINWHFNPPHHREQQAGKLLIKLREDAGPDQALWSLQIVKGETSEHACFINSGHADTLLFELGKDVFEDCDASWEKHRRMCVRFKIDRLRAEADELEAGLAASEADDTPEMV